MILFNFNQIWTTLPKINFPRGTVKNRPPNIPCSKEFQKACRTVGLTGL